MFGFNACLLWSQRRSKLILLLKRQESIWAGLFFIAALIAYGVAILKGLEGCPICASQRLGMVAISLSFIVSLRFKTCGFLLVMIASFYVMDQAYLQLVLENGVRLEQFAYIWGVYQNAQEADQHQLLPLLRPFYDLTWPFTKLATYSLFLSMMAGLKGLHTFIKEVVFNFVEGIRQRSQKIKRPLCPCLVLLSLLLPQTLHAQENKDFGVQGALFEIVEEDFVSMIQRKAHTIDLTSLQTLWKQHIEEWIPHPVAGLQRTSQPRSFVFDPTYTVPRSWADHEGKVFAPRGLKVNPLKILPFTGRLLFVQGTSKAQMLKVKDYPLSTKAILVSGSPLLWMKALGRPLYFDQGGVLTTRLGIKQVPAFVEQTGDVLRVEEKREIDL